MKLRRIISVGLALLMAIPLFSVTVSADASLSYNDAAFYDSVSNATANASDKIQNSISCISVTPDVSSNSPVSVNHTSIANKGIALSGIRYIVYNYYYGGNRTDLRPTLTLHESEFNMGATITAEAMDVLASGFKSGITLRQIVFDVGDYMGAYYFPNGTVPEMTFNPYGDIPASGLSANDKIYLNQILFRTSIPSGTTEKYPVIFSPGRADAVGTDPETMFVAKGGTVTLPENPYSLEGYKFNGWICSDGNVKKEVGDQVTITVKDLYTGAYHRETGRTYFVADWVVDDIPDIKKVKFSSYQTGGTTPGSFDSVLSPVRYNISSSNAGENNEAVISSQKWHNMPLDLKHYKYCAVLFYWNSESESTDKATPVLTLVNDDTVESALLQPIDVSASAEISRNQWSVVGFDIGSRIDYYKQLEENTQFRYTNFDVTSILKKLEIRPFGYKNKEDFANDNIYVADVIFFAEKPSDIYFSNGFIEGSNGYFNPDENLTKGQAAVILARIMGYIDGTASSTPTAYTDITKSDYWYDEVCYLEAKGALNPAEDGNVFNGTADCSRKDFVSYLVNAAAGITGATAFGEMPAASDSFSGTLTRAEAVVYANTILRGRNYTNSDIAAFEDTNYIDVEKTDWYAPDVVLCSDDVILYKNADGDTEICTFPAGRSVTKKMLNAGEEYLSDLDATVEERIAEIRATNAVPTPKTGGTTYYVSSSSGNTTNAGTINLSPLKVNELGEVSEKLNLNPGDVVLFKRGDVFMGTLTVENGVTYSAYGTGNKPMFVNTSVTYSSVQTEWVNNVYNASLWEKVHEGDDGAIIWKYSEDIEGDVGAINLFENGTKFNDLDPEIVVAYKDTPSYNVSTGTYHKATTGKDGAVIAISEDEYDYRTALDHDLMFFHKLGAATGKAPTPESKGPLYLRCDEGNPVEIFSDITFNGQGHVIVADSSSSNRNGVTIDNICIRYFGSHGISLTSPSNFNITNCEFGWGGGSLHGMKDNATIKDENGNIDTNIKNFGRFGNAVEFYGAPANCKIDNCYVYEIYDAGITHQIAHSATNVLTASVYYTNNVLENSTYNIEYFMSYATGADGKRVDGVTRMMKDVYMTDNIIRRAGYGWGAQRPNNEPANIKGWVHENFGINQVIENNIIDRTVNLTNSGSSSSFVLEIFSTFAGCAPYLKDNTIVQAPGRHLMRHGATGTSISSYNIESEELLNTIAGDGNKVYFCEEDKNEYADKVFWK